LTDAGRFHPRRLGDWLTAQRVQPKGREDLTKEEEQMAQAKAGTSAQRSRTQRKRKKTSQRAAGSSSKSTKRNASKQNASKRPKRQAAKPPAAKVVQSTAKEAGKTAKEAGKTAKEAGKTVGRAAKKAKVPLLAGGAALAGAAGGIAVGAHQARRHKGLGIGKTISKVDADEIANAAKRVGSFGAQMGQMAGELQRARNGTNGVKRSPVEVVLEGLTSRRSSDG
jgi:hypothetical protein